MYNVIGGVIILAALSYFGYSVNGVYKYRTKLLEQMRAFFLFCESEISFYRTDIESLKRKYLKQNDNSVCRLLEKDADKAAGKEITDLFKSYVDGLCGLDSSSQNKYFADMKVKFEEIKKKNGEDAKGKGAVMLKLMPLAGLAILILLL